MKILPAAICHNRLHAERRPVYIYYVLYMYTGLLSGYTALEGPYRRFMISMMDNSTNSALHDAK